MEVNISLIFFAFVCLLVYLFFSMLDGGLCGGVYNFYFFGLCLFVSLYFYFLMGAGRLPMWRCISVLFFLPLFVC